MRKLLKRVYIIIANRLVRVACDDCSQNTNHIPVHSGLSTYNIYTVLLVLEIVISWSARGIEKAFPSTVEPQKKGHVGRVVLSLEVKKWSRIIEI